MKVEIFTAKDAMKEFLDLLDRLNKEEKKTFLVGLNVIFFDPLGRRILKYLAEEKNNE